VRGRLNLASRPFRNEALPNLLFVVGLVSGLGLTVFHAMHLRGLLGDSSSALQQQVRAQDAELQSLRDQVRAQRVPAPEASKLAEWRTVKDLVDRRTFSWTLLLSRLEATLPAGIRLLAIAPRLQSGRIELELTAIARSREDGYDFARALQEQGSFTNVYPTTVDASARGEEFRLMMVYSPPEARP
jgi:Tfp pilus assembly protein PilN